MTMRKSEWTQTGFGKQWMYGVGAFLASLVLALPAAAQGYLTAVPLVERDPTNSLNSAWSGGEWNTNANFEGWSTSNISGATVSGGLLTGTSSSTNPVIQRTGIVNGPDLDLGYNDFLEFKIKLPADYAGDIQIYYGVTNAGYADGYSVQSNQLGFAETRCFTVTNGLIAKDGASHVYRVNMSLEVWYRGQLTDLRIDPATTSGAAFEMDYVRIGDSGVMPVENGMDEMSASSGTPIPYQIESKHFVFGWNDSVIADVGMTTNWARLNLRNAEEAWAVFAKRLNYPPPRWTEAGGPYKVNFVCVYGGNFGGGPMFQISRYELRTDPPTWTTPHELAHVFQGPLNGGHVPGEYGEMHANYSRERWLDHFQALFPNQSGFVPGIMSEMHMNLPIGRNYYETWPIYLYLDTNPDNLPDLGDGTVAQVWQQMASGENTHETLKRIKTTPVKDILGYYARRGLNYNYPGFPQIKNKIGAIQEWEQLAEPIRRPDNLDWWQIPAERAPMQGGFSITELVPSNSVVTVQLHGLLVEGGGADWRASLIVVSDSGAERYSTLMTNNATGSVTLAADEHKVYLSVAATPDDYQLYYYDESVHPYRSDYAKRRFHYEFKVTGATPKVRDNGSTSGLVQHPNGGGYKASSATVDATAYIGPNARVLDTAQVRNFARVEDYAVVKENARLADMAVARGHAQVFGNSVMTNKAIVADFARLGGAAVMSGTARVLEHATVTGGTVTDQAVVKGSAGTWGGTFSGNAIGDGDYAFARDIRNASVFGHLPWVGIPDNWLVPLPPGLFACYEFSAASELVARDTYAATDGIYRGAPGWEGTNGTHTGIALLNGTDQWVQLERAVADLPAMTVSAWVKWDGGAANQTLFQFGDGASKYILFTPSNGSGVAELTASDGTTTYSIPAASALPVGVWIQVAVSLDGTYGKFTVNGGTVASGSLPMRPDQILPPNVAGNPAHNFIGRRTAGNFFDGSIDAFNVYGIAIPTFTLVTVDTQHSTVLENAPYESFRFTRTSLVGASTNGDLTVTYTITGTATSVDDYELLSGTVVISNGQSYVDVQLRPVFDTITDEGETVTLTLAPSNDYTGTGSATVTILDVDALSASQLAWYRFNETTGTNAVDSSGNTNDAILVNGPAWSAGALTFDGDDDYVQTPVPNGGERTLSAWINPHTSATGGTMASVFDTDVAGQYGTGWGVKDGKIVVILDDLFWFPDITITHNEWQHISLTFDATQARLYRNGTLAATHDYTRGDITAANYIIGRSNANEYDCFDGEIRDAKIYDRTIYDPEAMEIYMASAPALAPRDLNALAGHGFVTLGWQTADAGETSYTVSRATISGGPYTVLTNGVLGTSYTDNTVTNGTTYYYVVAAVSNGGVGPNSNEASATPSAGTSLPPPWAHVNVGTAAGSPTTVFSGGQVAVSGAGEFIKSGTGSASDSFRFVYIPVVGDCTISARVVDLGTNNAAAKAGVMIRESLAADSRHAATLLSTANLHFIRRTTAGNTGAQNTAALQSQPWVKIVRSGTSFSSYYSVNGVNWTQIGTTTTVSMSTTATYYVGLAVCSGSTTALANSVLSDVTITGGYPTGLSATAGNSQVALKWIGVTGATSYRVKRGTVSGGPYSLLASPNVTNYLDSALTNGTTYYYVVSAHNGTSESTNSVQVFATPSAAQAGIPANVAASDGGTQITVSWDAISNAVSNRVRRAVSPSGPFTVVGTTAALSFVDTPVSTVSNYFYTVCGVNADNEEGPASDVVELVRGLYFDPNSGSAGSVTNNGSYSWLSASWAIAPGGLLVAQTWLAGKEARFAATDPGAPLAYGIDLAGYNSGTHGNFSGIRISSGMVTFSGNVENFYLTMPITVTAETGASLVFQQTRTGANVQAFNLNSQPATFHGDVTLNCAGIGNNGSIIVGSGILKLGNAIVDYSPAATVLEAGTTLNNIGDAGKYFNLGALTMKGATLAAANAGHASYGNYVLNGGLTVTGTAASVISADLRCQGNTTQTLNVGETGVDVDLLVSGRLGHINGLAWSYANKTGAGTLKISGTNGLGGLTVSAGTVILEGPNAIASMDVNSIVNNAAVILSVLSGTNSYPRALLGTGLYTKTGAGMLELTSAASHTGNIRVQEGVLRLTQAALGDTSALTVESGAQVELAFSGKDAVAAITLNGMPLPYGIYNATTQPATFTGAGSLVISPPTLIWNNSAETGLWNLTDLNWTGVAWTNNYNARFSHTNAPQTVTLKGALTAFAVNIGNGGNNANYTFAGGALSAVSITLQGKNDNNSPANATAQFSDTTIAVPGGDIGIGRMGLVIGGSSTVTVARIGGAGIADVTSADWGQLTITNNAVVTATNGIAGNTTAWGINLDGGTLMTKGINYGPHGGIVNLKFNGTRVKASEPNPDFLTVTGGVDYNPEILAGGAWLDSNGYDMGIGLSLQGSGALNKLGAGTLTLTGANTFTGPVTIDGGTLYANMGSAANNRVFSTVAGITVNSNATLRSSANALFGWDATQAKPITVNAGGMMTLDTGFDVNVGLLTLNGGTLAGDNITSGWGSWNFGRGTDKKLAVTADSTVSSKGVVLRNGATVDVVAGKTLSFTGFIINNSDGPSALIKTGSGLLTLAGTNTYTGATTVRSGALNLTGTIAAGGDLVVADQSGRASFVMSGTISRNLLRLGNASGAVAAGYQTAGSVVTTMVAGNSFGFGHFFGSYGFYRISSGTLQTQEASIGTWGDANNGGDGMLEVAGGTVNNLGWLVMNRSAGGSSTAQNAVLDVSGGSLTYAGGGLVANWGGSISNQYAVVNVSGSGSIVATANAPIAFNGNAANTGILNLNGGTVMPSAVTGARGFVNFNGGTLKAYVDNGAFLTVGAAYVRPGGAVVDSNGKAVTIAQALLAPTGTGVVSVAVSAGGSGYTCPPIVKIEGGTYTVPATALAVMADDATGNGTYKVASLTITSPGVYTADPTSVALVGGGPAVSATFGAINTAANASGGLTKSGAGTLTLSAANTYTGATVVSAGRLVLNQPCLETNAAVEIASGAVLELAFSATNRVGRLSLGGVAMAPGIYSATTHPTLFAGTGSLSIAYPVMFWNNSAATSIWDLDDANWNGAAWTNNYVALFSHTNAPQTVTLQGTLTANAVRVGNGGNNANYTLLGGSGVSLAAYDFVVQGAAGNDPGLGTAVVSNLTLAVTNDLGVGRWDFMIGGSSALTIGGQLRATSVGDWGRVTIQDTASVTASGGVNGANFAWGLTLNGGTLITPFIRAQENTYGVGSRLTFNGTTVKATQDTNAFVTVDTTAQAYVGNAGAIFDTDGKNITVGVKLVNVAGQAGSLTKLGTGALTLMNLGNTYSGGTAVNQGTLTIDVQGSQTQSAVGVNKAVTVNSGATLRLAKTDALGLYGANPSSLLISGTMTIASAIHASIGNYGITLNGGTIASEDAGDADGNYVFDGAITTLANDNSSVISANTIKLRNNSGGGTANQSVTFDVANGAAATDLLVSSVLINGNGANGLLKTNAGTLSLAGTNTYTGATIIRGGRLVLTQPCLSRTAAVEVDSDAVLELAFSATNRVGSLKLGGVAMTPGVYNVSTHPTLFAGTGSLVILSPGEEGLANYVGQVTDPQGNPVTNATVVLRLNATDIPSSVGATQSVTDVNGYYNITHQATNYVITASKTGYMIKSDTILASDPVKNLQFSSTNRNIPAMEWLLFAADSDDLPAVGGTGNWNLDYCTFDNRTALVPVAPVPAIVTEYGAKWMKGTGNLSSYKLNQYDWTTPVTNNGATVVSVVKIGDIAAKINDERDGQSVIISFFNDSLTLAVWRDGRVFVKRNNVFTKSTLTFSKDQTVLFSLVVQPDGTFKVFARTLDVVTGIFGASVEVINETTTSPFTAFTPGGAWWLRQIQVGSLFGNAGIEGRAYWSGLIGDTFVYKGALSDADRVTLENDIAGKTETTFLDLWKLTVTTSGNGSVQPSGTVWVRKGASQVFTLSPDLGYKIDTVTLDANTPVAISGSAWTNVNVSADGTNHFTFVALPPKTVTGVIKNSLNEPVAGAHVVLKVNASDIPTSAGAYQTTTGADGSYQFPSVIALPAAYTVVVSKEGYRIAFDTLGMSETVKDVTLSQRSRFVPSMEWLFLGATASGLGAENSTADWSLMYLDLPGYGKFDSAAPSITGATVTNLLSTKWGTMNGWDGVTWYQRACAYRVNRWGNLTASLPVNGGSAVVLAHIGNLNVPNKGGAESMLFTIFNTEFSLGLKAGGGAFVQCNGQASATSAQTFAEGQTVLFSCVVQTNRSWEVWARVRNPDYSFGASQKILEAAQSSSFLSVNPGGDWWVQQVNIGNQDGNIQWEGTRYWAGGIGDTFVYKTALSADERTLLERDVINDWASRKGQGTMEFDCASGAPLPGNVEMATGNMSAFVFSFTNGSQLNKSKNIFTVATAAAGVTLTGVPVMSGLTPDWTLENSGNTIKLKYNRGLIILLR